MYACPHCDSTDMFLAFKDGILVKVLEDNRDVDGLENVKELLCAACNRWFPNPTLGEGAHRKQMTGELVTITGLKGKGTIKVVATGLVFPFHYDTYQDEAERVLEDQPRALTDNLREFSRHHDHTIALRVKEAGNPNTWVYRLDRKRLWRKLRS